MSAGWRPVVWLPGDNDWTDCHRASNGGYDPIERLNHERQLFTATSQSLGQHTLTLTRESSEGGQFAEYSENVRWSLGPVVYVGLNVQGSNDNFPRHKPRFSSGMHCDDPTYTALWQALYAAGADVVLVGHDHDYERFAPQRPDGVADPSRGIREFVVGTGGKTHYGFRAIRRNSQVRNTDTFGVLRLALHPNGYDWRFVPEPGKHFSDSGHGTCH